ncbi:hypothetical protein MKW92_036436 [Papaver armeniacum]|nr:hypothetical protein MKW92_036436 [Papaver armeniacum]
MAAALECWSGRNSTDEDMAEQQVLMKTHDRSEGNLSNDSSFAYEKLDLSTSTTSSSLMQKKLQKISRNVSEAITNLKNSLNLDSISDLPKVKIQSSRKLMWGSVIRNLTQLYPGSQLPEKLVTNVRKHYDSLPVSYSLAGFEMEDVFLHIRLIEQTALDENSPAIYIQDVTDDGTHGSVFKLTFACNSLISWPAMSGTLDSSSICCKKIQIFEKKGFTLGIILVLVEAGQEKSFKMRIENALKSALKKPKPLKLPFGLCGRQQENNRDQEVAEMSDVCEQQENENGVENANTRTQLQTPLADSSVIVCVDEWQTISSGQDEIGKWLLNSDQIEFLDQIGPNLFKGVCKGKRVMIEKLKGCEKGSPYEFEVRKDLLELMSFGHKNILQFYGVSIEENHGLCVVTKMMEGGTLHELIQKKKKLNLKDIIKIASDVAAGIKFMNDHGIAYRDLNTQRILVCKNNGEATDYETDGYQWLARGDPESVTETWMSNVYSFGMVVWEMVTGEAAYSAYSPVQAAVGIAACGLRPDIPKDCPHILRSLMVKCWNNCPSKRPPFSEILRLLLRSNNNSSLLHMLPCKRAAVVGGGEKEENNNPNSSITTLIKKSRNSAGGDEENQTRVSAATMALGDGNSHEIDDDLHSRQLDWFLHVVAKNLILAGVKSVTLHDEGNVELWDLSSNFIFSEDDVGKNRAVASVTKLQELNNVVLISALSTPLTTDQLSNFQAVVFTDVNLEKAFEFDEFCRSQEPPIAFIKTEVRGLFGSVFCDFGPNFTVLDVDGEEPHTGIIASISNDNPALVSCVDDERLEFQDGDLVLFSEVQGMPELNDGKPRKVKNTRPYSFNLDEDTTKYGAYARGGIVTQVKQPKLLNFKSLREALKDPGDFLLSDFSKFDHADKLISVAIAINEASGDARLEEVDKKILRHFAFGARAVLNPMAAMFGGIVGQEVMKACSGKFHPLYQFFYFDSLESLPTEPLDASDLKPQNSRYDAQISVFGSKIQKKLEDAKVFMVGSGALGCEFLKNLALMGVCCNQQGKLTITDDDVIEKSNLSRQFLFRDWNIGQGKSTVAASAASSINPSLHVEALQNRASPDTENVFNDAFWENLDVVINALDNVNARMYMDQRCLYFQKPLLESGTLGAKCNTQMVIPHLTENYGASRDPPEKQAPMCTVHSFPHNIDHSNAYLSNRSEYNAAMKTAGDAQARDNLERVVECLDSERCESFQDCITWARLKFEDYFANRVKQLTFTFPEDSALAQGTILVSSKAISPTT